MKKYIIMLLAAFSLTACKKSLDLESLSGPVDAQFYNNEQELNVALTGVYNSMYILQEGYNLPLQTVMDNAATDIGIVRGLSTGGFMELGQGNHSSTSGGFLDIYSKYYVGIARANSLLENMPKAQSAVPEVNYNSIKAQALVIRAYHYMYLTEIFGDVPYIDKVITSTKDGYIPRTPIATVVDNMLEDLQTAADLLPNSGSSEKERITKGLALGLRARIALNNGRYDEAAKSAKAVMDNAGAFGLSLDPDYKELFQTAGVNSPEIMLTMPFKQTFQFNLLHVAQGSRNFGAYSQQVPTQSMIDSYEATDGKTIDQSSVYDVHNPFENRDPRLKASIITPGSEWAGEVFYSHPDSVTIHWADGTKHGDNRNCRNVSWPAAFSGYLWKKYTPEEDEKNVSWESYINFSLMRYAEVLLTYAEAKIEANQIDASVLNAINQVRARAYGADVSNTNGYPAITITNQSELRQVIRRERKVELANEGFRLFDIRRWKIAEKVMPVTIYGQILNPATATGIPLIDADCFVSYTGIQNQYDLNTDARFTNAQNRKFDKTKDYLCPIPQQEIDTYKGAGFTLTQNPGY